MKERLPALFFYHYYSSTFDLIRKSKMNSRYVSLCFTLFFLCLNAYAKQTEKDIEKPQRLSNVSYSSVLALNFNDANFKLPYGSDSLQYGMLWLPPSPKGSEATTQSQGDFPLIILVHGGCWLNAYDIKHTYALSSALAAAGYAVWSLEYRRTGDDGGGWPGSLEDIQAGIAYIDKLESYSVDLSKVVLTGHSAGGHLALLAGAKNQNISAVIGLAAITDIEKYSRGENSCQSVTSKFMGGSYEEKISEYNKANPVKQTLHPRTILLQGGADMIVPIVQATHSNIPFQIIDGAGHFDWIHPHSKAFEAVLLRLQDIFSP